jgi:hypothetical protein
VKAKWIGGIAGAAVGVALVVRETIRVPIVESLEAPELVASVPSPWIWIPVVALASIVGALAGRWLGRFDAEHALLPLWVPGLAGGAYVPGMLKVFPFLAAFAGRLLDVVLILCAVLVLWKILVRRGFSFPLRAGQVAFIAFVMYLGIGYRLQESVGISGDEPHYLLIAYSLLHDGDLAVQNNYAAEDYRQYFNGKIGPHLAHGTPYSVHGIGLPLILLPGFALLGLPGVLLTEAFLGALTVREIFKAAEALGLGRSAAGLGAVGFALTVPAVFLCVSAYPELPAALIVAGVFRKLVEPSPPTGRKAFFLGLAIGVLPFLHIKYIPLAVILGLGAMWFWRAWIAKFAGGWILGLISLVVFFAWLHGNPNPLASYGRQRIFGAQVPLGFAGLLFDQEFGLLPHSPFYLFALVAFGALLRQRPRLAALSAALFLAVAAPGAAHPLWTGGTSPPARFLFPALPVLALIAAAAWQWKPVAGKSARASWVPVLLIGSICLGAFMAFGPDPPLHLNQRDGSGRVWIALGSAWDLTHYLPSLVRADIRSVVLSVSCALVICMGFVLFWKGIRIPLPPLGVVVLIGVILLDGLAPGEAAPGSRGRWMARLMEDLPLTSPHAFVLLPFGRFLSSSDVIEKIEVPLERSRRPKETMETMPIVLPAGQFKLKGVSDAGVRLCNGEGCFDSPGPEIRFVSGLRLARFFVRSTGDVAGLTLVPEKLAGVQEVAERTFSPVPGVRLHSLDDHAYLDPKGYWVRAGERSRFVIEGDCSDPCSLLLANGGRENWVEVAVRETNHRFSLGPWERRQVAVATDDDTLPLSVMSVAGFRPSELDTSVDDSRPLGVFLTLEIGKSGDRPH